jgi:hypothetical protein
LEEFLNKYDFMEAVVVTPGERLGDASSFIAGVNTHVFANGIHASLVGELVTIPGTNGGKASETFPLFILQYLFSSLFFAYLAIIYFRPLRGYVILLM